MGDQADNIGDDDDDPPVTSACDLVDDHPSNDPDPPTTVEEEEDTPVTTEYKEFVVSAYWGVPCTASMCPFLSGCPRCVSASAGKATYTHGCWRGLLSVNRIFTGCLTTFFPKNR